jgi:hypothetical protein
LFAFGLYNCIASACIGGVWGMDGTVLGVLVVLKPLDTLCSTAPEVCEGARRRWLTDFEGLTGPYSAPSLVWQRFFLPRAEIAPKEYTRN